MTRPPMELDYLRDRVGIPNCDDPVFRMWCNACNVVAGQYYDPHDVRIARLQDIMDEYDPTYDPEQDDADDYLTRGL